MRAAVPAIASVIAFALATGMASACDLRRQPLVWFDKPIGVAADGSFKLAGETFGQEEVGRPVVDIGNEKIGQRLIAYVGCGEFQRLLVADCAKGDLVVIKGLPVPEIPLNDSGGGPIYTIDLLYPPAGKIRLSKSVTVAGLVSVAKRAGYEYEIDAAKAFAKMKKKNRYNPYSGCKLFYPESLGAKL